VPNGFGPGLPDEGGAGFFIYIIGEKLGHSEDFS
jgi:hypothetical protein